MTKREQQLRDYVAEEAVKTLAPLGWTPVSRALPPEYREVLAQNCDFGVKVIAEIRNDGKWHETWTGDIAGEITHWMPLP